MGRAAGPAAWCGGCFAGFGRGEPPLRPDSSPNAPNGNPPVVNTIEEALNIERPFAGTFVPSPMARERSVSVGAWASPVPRGNQQGQPLEGDFDFDMIIDECFVPQPLASRLDTDIPAGRVLAVKNEGTRSRFEAEQLLASPGTLPPPMTADQRE
ncbi:unnamed protein product, partial [Polarella glacialis]